MFRWSGAVVWISVCLAMLTPAACGGGSGGGADTTLDADATADSGGGDAVRRDADTSGDATGPKDTDAAEPFDGATDADAGPDADATPDADAGPDAAPDTDATPDADGAEVADPPSLTFLSTPVEFALAGFEWKYRPRVYADGEPVFELLEAPLGMELTGQTLTWSPTPQQKGTHTMRLRATVGGLTSIQVAQIQTAAPTPLAQTVVGPEGGTAAVTGFGGGYEGAAVTIPAGSLSEAILLRLGTLDAALHPAALSPLNLKPLVLSPAGVTFGQSALVQLPIDPDATTQLSNLAVYVMSEASGCWSSAQIASVDPVNGLVAVPMGHFSIAVAGVNAWTLDQTLVDTSADESCTRALATTAVLSAPLDALPTSAVALFEPPGGVASVAAAALLPGLSGSLRHIQVADLLVADSPTASVAMSNLAVTLVLPGDGSARVVIADQDGAVRQKRVFASVVDAWASDIEPLMRGVGLVHRFDRPQSAGLSVRVRSYLRYDSGDSSAAPFAPMEQGTLLAESTFGPAVGGVATGAVDSDCDGVGEAADIAPAPGLPEVTKSPQDAVSVLVGNALALLCSASGQPETDALTYTWKSSVAADTFVAAGAAVQFTASSPGTRGVTCTTVWKGKTLTRVFTILAQAANPANKAPTCKPSADAKLLALGGTTGLVASAVDPDGDTALKVEWGVLTAAGEFGGSPFLSAFGGASTLFGPVTAPGVYKVACRASDASGPGPHGFVEVTVLPGGANLPPSVALLSPGGATVAPGEALTLIASARDSNALSFTWSPSAFVTPVSSDGAKGSATFVSETAGLYSVFVSISDGTNAPTLLKAVILVQGAAAGLDTDGDGFFTAGDPPDCDDSDPLVNPAAVEICGNGIDDNCSGAVNEGFPDLDGDGVAECVSFGTDTDGDGDGVVDAADNCPFVPNPGQADADGDSIGDACDLGCPPVCNDGNPCTTDSCDGATLNCQFIPNTVSCSDGDACTVGDACAAGACVPGATTACDDGNPCTDDACDALLGCASLPNTATCSDGNPCTLNDACVAGACIGGGGPDCYDGNPCTTDACDVQDGDCAHLPLAGTCDDANACTQGDLCSAGACLPGLPVDCDDENACTADSCDPTSGACVNLPIAAGCDDGNACTAGDSCVGGACVGGANACACAQDIDCAPKDDGDACNGTLICKLNACVVNPETIVTCAPSTAACQKNICVPATGLCALAPVPDTTGCDDGDGCTLGDTCTAGVCNAGGAVDCDDANPCTDDSCAPATGLCAQVPNAAACDDQDACTTGDVCAAGVCVGVTPTSCDDQNPCTTDGCAASKGCAHIANSLPCDDGDACTVGDACAGNACVGGGNVCKCQGAGDCEAFEDGDLCNGTLACLANQCVIDPNSVVVCEASLDPCLLNTCEPDSGACVAKEAGAGTACDDGDPCTVGEACSSGACAGGGALDCDDGDPCTVDTCDPLTGDCAATPILCGPGATCSNGVCSGGPLATCRELVLCYFACELPGTASDCKAGCEAAATPASTDELDVIIACLDAACAADPSPDCDNPLNPACAPEMASCLQCDDDVQCAYGNVCAHATCTVDGSCDVSPVADGAACDDGDACTANDACFAGECEAAPAVDCDDGNLCTADACDGGGGCAYSAVEGCNPTDNSDGDGATADTDCDDHDPDTFPGAPEICDAKDNDCDGAAEGLVGAGCVGGVCIEGSCAEVGLECVTVSACEQGCAGDNPCVVACVSAASPAYQAWRFGINDCLLAACGDGDDELCTNAALDGPCQQWAEVCGLSGGCTPDCGGKGCGDDGCGGECDGCSGGEVCIDFQCAAPECFDALDCAPGELCNVGLCRDVNCPDGCLGGAVCTPMGCQAPVPCLTVDDCPTPDSCVTATCDDAFCAFEAVVCDDANPCTAGICDGSGPIAACTFPALQTGAPCDLLGACGASYAFCSLGACVAGDPPYCFDGDPCTVDSCQEGVGCVNAPACGSGEVCVDDGVCVPAGTGCDSDANCISADPCLTGRCIQQRCIETSACDDSNPCTLDVCELTPGVACSHELNALNGTPCDTAFSVCTSFVCDAGACVEDVASPPPCPEDADACTFAQCFDPAGCGLGLIGCEDGDPCTVDVCDSQLGCVSTPVDCGADSVCYLGGCIPAVPCATVVDCPASDNPCASVMCDGSFCLPLPISCDDGNSCTEDFCDQGSPLSPCQHAAAPYGAPCGDLCNGGFCIAGSCEGLTLVDCSDGDPCTLDGCDVGSGACLFDPTCGSGEVCVEGACYTGATCSDPGECDDGDPCTVDDCLSSTCVSRPKCDDGNPCTADTCTLGSCTSDPTSLEDAPCGDEASCMESACHLGACMPVASVTCPDDGNVCTEAICILGIGCRVAPTNCAGDACHTPTCDLISGCGTTPVNCGPEYSCYAGGCYPTPACADVSDCPAPFDTCAPYGCEGNVCTLEPIDCDDSDPCTSDTCDAGGGCVNSPVDCGLGGICIGGECQCAPDCTGKQCGDNGCGGTCGDCAPTDICNGGLCFAQ